jgi:hypothetical protein
VSPIREDLPPETRLALLEVGIEKTDAKVDTYIKATIGLVATLLAGMLLFLFSAASGWLGGGG